LATISSDLCLAFLILFLSLLARLARLARQAKQGPPLAPFFASASPLPLPVWHSKKGRVALRGTLKKGVASKGALGARPASLNKYRLKKTQGCNTLALREVKRHCRA